MQGANRVARFIIGLTRKLGPHAELEVAMANGEPGLFTRLPDGSRTFMTIETDGERVYAVRIIRNPDKLSG